ncbi:CC/Se motif family (seleno)protein [Bacillus canaveralius]|uniref:CC/Se motif family (seleno)protein n=1 Tax=Bacillus canaveralius TaxID=1403243 RepID=UPI000F784F03|nr:CC/Se motif family (seleno)protein [Bacillus canaveralius]RSK52365.1 Fe-S oxidoreductase [Bacillus canaveralius]
MNIQLDDEAHAWIKSKGKYLTVKTLEVKGCCAAGVQELLAIPGKPKDIQKYNEFIVDNLSIFIQKNIEIKDRLELKISGFGFLKSIAAKGFLE